MIAVVDSFATGALSRWRQLLNATPVYARSAAQSQTGLLQV